MKAKEKGHPMCSCGHAKIIHRSTAGVLMENLRDGACNVAGCGCQSFWLDGYAEMLKPAAFGKSATRTIKVAGDWI